MNPDTNKFEELTEYTKKELEIRRKIDELQGKACGVLYRPNGQEVPKHWSIFSVGENYVINNYTFRCAYIGETSILFEPVGELIVNESPDPKAGNAEKGGR